MHDGTSAIVCRSKVRPPKRCTVGKCWGDAVILCDHPLGEGRTCDREICRRHAFRLGTDDHRCPDHATPLLAGVTRAG